MSKRPQAFGKYRPGATVSRSFRPASSRVACTPSGPAAPAIPDPERYDYGSHLILAAGWAALFGTSGFLAQGRSSRALAPMARM